MSAQELILNAENISLIKKELLKDNSNSKLQHAFYRPSDKHIYLSNSKAFPEFYKENRIANASGLGQFLGEIQKFGSIKSPELVEGTIKTYEPRYQSVAEDYFKWIKTAASGGSMIPENFTQIEVTNILSQLRNTNERNFVMQDVGTEIPTEKEEGEIPIETGFDAQFGIARGAEIPSVMTQYTKVPFELQLLGLHIARHRELGMANLAFDPYKRSISRVSRAITRKKAKRNSDLLFAVTVTDTGSTWDAVTGGDSNNNPFLADIGPVSDTITGVDGNPAQIIMSDPTYRAYETNTWIKGSGTASNTATVTQSPGVAKKVTLTGTNLTGFIDNINPNDDAVVIDAEAFARLQGPSAVLNYDDVHHRSEGYYYIEYYDGLVVETNKAIKITNVLT